MSFNFTDRDMFLSNFYMSEIIYRGRAHKSAEHLYNFLMAAKAHDRDEIFHTTSGRAARFYGKFIAKPKPHWDVVKVRVMLKVMRLKFRDKKLRRMLIEIGDKELTELNFRNETFWGVCGCTQHQRTGLNMLGKILMKIRDEVKHDHKAADNVPDAETIADEIKKQNVINYK